MSKKDKKRTVLFRRKDKTDYKKRLKLLLSGRPRLVIRRMSRGITAQVIEYSAEGDKVLASASSRELAKQGWNGGSKNLPSAYLVGYSIGAKASRKGIKKAVLDIGLVKSVKESRIYAALKGAIDAGLDIPVSENVLPKKERIQGNHIKEYIGLLKGKTDGSEQILSYLKKETTLKDLPKHLEDTKKMIMQVTK